MMIRRATAGVFSRSATTTLSTSMFAAAATTAAGVTSSSSSPCVVGSTFLSTPQRHFFSASSPALAKRANKTPKAEKKSSAKKEPADEQQQEQQQQQQQAAAAAAEAEQQQQAQQSQEEEVTTKSSSKKTKKSSSSSKKQGGGKDKKKQKEEEGAGQGESNSNALVTQGAYIPMNGTVEQYSKGALTREGRYGIIEAPIWVEDSTYAPILARGKKNVYEYTDDIPKDVKPMFGDTQIWQTREYFEYRRNAENIKYRIFYVGSAFIVFFGIAGGVAFTRIWIDQPSEVATIRRTLLGNAYGRVLELAAGQGINIGVYPFAVTDVVLVDSNPQELHILRSRLPRTAYPTYQVVCDRAEELKAFPDHCFDTVVDMFGLCHYKDPVRVLQQMQRVCKPTGQILLLEHGRTDYSFVNWLLDYKAEAHYEKTQGCQWNKDLRKIFQDAGLVVRHLETQHYGTTYIVVAHPKAPEKDLPLTAGGKPAAPIMNTETPAWAS